MVAVPASEKDEPRRVLDDDGKPLPGVRVPTIPDDTLIRIFDAMLLTRIIDGRMMQLRGHRRLGFYVTSTGEEASHFAVAPLRPTDWVFPSHREQAAWFFRGYAIQQYVDQLFGNQDDPIKGRQMPVHHSASWLHLVSISSPVGTQIPQAVGAAYAARVQGKDDVMMALFGEGASSTGEFHVGLNFAGVWKAPCVFVCRNHGWAIGRPGAAQTAARTFAARAIGYGMPGIRVDGSDVLAVWQVASDAIERARAGEGPTLIEALTYRDPGQPSGTEVPHAAPIAAISKSALTEIRPHRDPLHRLRGYLRHRGLWSERGEAELTDQYHEQIASALAAAARKPAPAIDTLFEDVYEHPPWNLDVQRAYLQAQPRAENPYDSHGDGDGDDSDDGDNGDDGDDGDDHDPGSSVR
jgi:2-oxoisovalerate dehydrogenase E1 component alpha subunit